MPFWNSLEDVIRAYRFLSMTGLCLGILAGICALIASFSAIGTYYYGNRKDELMAIKSERELDFIRNKITSFSIKLHVEYSWDLPNNPLLDSDQGGGVGEEDHLMLLRINPETKFQEELYFKRTSLYKIAKIGENRASFNVDLVPRESGFPLGSQISELKQITAFVIYIPVKNYWMNGRDNYNLQVEKIQIRIAINGKERELNFNSKQMVTPTRIQHQVIWGYITPTGVFDYQ